MTEFTTNNPHQGAYLVYLNGLEIPCPYVTVSYGVWQIPEATLSFAPSRLLQRLGAEDRIEVVVFFLDTLTDPDAPTFRLLYEGEICGWNYSNSHGQRMMQFNAVADMSIMLQLHHYFLNNVDSIVALATDPSTGASAVAQPGAFYPFSLFKKGLIFDAGQKTGSPDIERPFEILYNAVIGMTGSAVSAGPGLPAKQLANTVPALNYFSRWSRKRNFQNRFAALPLFEDTPDQLKGVFPMFKAVQDELALGTMSVNLATSVGDTGTMWSTFQEIFGKVLFEIAMIPTAPAFRVRLSDGVIVGPPVSVSSPTDPLQPLRLINYFVKPQLLFAIPPTCNLILPSMTPSLQYQESYASQPTRFYVSDSLITAMLTPNPFITMATTVGWPPEVNAVLRRTIAGAPGQNDPGQFQVTSNARNVLVFPEEFFRGPVSMHAKVPAWYQLIQNRRQQIKSQKDVSTDAVAETKAVNALFELYAENDFSRQKYERRGGAVDLAFNPFLVPGFPAPILDERSQQFDILGYIMSVTQTMTTQGNGSMRTACSYSFGRTFKEMFDLLAADMDRLGIVLGSAPAEPVDELRQIGQDFAQADEFYGALFHGRQDLTDGRKASFDFRDVIGYTTTDPEVGTEAIFIDGPTAATRPVNVIPVPAVPGTSTPGAVSHNLDGSRDLQPRPGYSEIFTSYDAAMRYVARPICSIDEYIRFLHGVSTVDEAIASGQVSGIDDSFGYSKNGQAPTARYYTRIRRLRQGPGARPSPAASGATVSAPPAGGTVQTAVPWPGAVEALPPDYAQTRADWDKILEAYRLEILTEQAPKT